MCMRVGSILRKSVVRIYIGVYNHSEAQPQLVKVRHETKIKSKNCKHSSQQYILQTATKREERTKTIRTPKTFSMSHRLLEMFA